MPKVTVIDYGMGNLLSVTRAFEHCGAEVKLTGSPDEVKSAEFLVLPGVGAFADGMRELEKRKLIPAIRNFVEKERPFLGICLGMQMLMEQSEEFGRHKGLGFIPGRVERIPDTAVNHKPHKIPHIGWNELRKPSLSTDWNDTPLCDVEPGESVYFVHSYTAVPQNESDRLADCLYNGRRISAAVRSGKIYGCQFHPEKSGPVGLRIIQAFLRQTFIPHTVNQDRGDS